MGIIGLLSGLFSLLLLPWWIGIAIATALLAERKGRSLANWFFLSLFWGLVGLLILACTGDFDDYGADALARVLWAILLIPLIVLFLCYPYFF